jgi:hypothetical protein
MPPTACYSFGDVILVPFPFTDQIGIKKRPAVVVSSAAYQAQRRDLIIASVTKPILATIEKRLNFPNGTNDNDVDMTSQALMALQPWIWREQDRAQSEVVAGGHLPAIMDTREILRRRVYAASGLAEARAREPKANGNGHPIPGRQPRIPFVDPYRRGRR